MAWQITFETWMWLQFFQMDDFCYFNVSPMYFSKYIFLWLHGWLTFNNLMNKSDYWCLLPLLTRYIVSVILIGGGHKWKKKFSLKIKLQLFIKKKFRQWWSTIPPISTKWITTILPSNHWTQTRPRHMTWDLNPLSLLIKLTGPPRANTNINKH
jgi:hypothetical protein